MTDQAREQLIATARTMLERLETGEIDRAESIKFIDASVYSDRERFEREKAKIFRALPVILAASSELSSKGDYKTMEVAGVPVLLTRTRDGRARAYLNSCTHRGSMVACGRGNATRFTCPYHGWTFSNQGDLIGVASEKEYGLVDRTGSGLVEFSVCESAGLIWVVLDPDSTVDTREFMQGVDSMLEGFGLETWSVYHQCELPGANWKLAFDAHMDFYHLPVLHKETFGKQISNLAQYFFHGPHQRLGLMSENTVEQDDLGVLKGLPEAEWPTAPLLFGEWIIFPNVSLNCFHAGERVMVISQIFPGDTPEHSSTVQTFLVENQPSEQTKTEVDNFVSFINKVVGEEDLPMSRKQQQSLSSGLMKSVQFGRNEVGLQRYYAWLDHYLETSPDSNLDNLVAEREIYRNLMSFAQAMDQRDWKAMEDLLADDATADLGQGEIVGKREIVDFIRPFLEACGTTQHLLGNVVIDVDGDSATSRSYVSDMHLGKADKTDLSFRTLGEYRDEWVCLNGSWLLKRRLKDNRATVGTMDVFA